MKRIIDINHEDFEELLKTSIKPIVIDFWAEWCGPCKMIAPILEEISEEREDVMIVKVDVDNVRAVAEKYGIRSIPTLMVIKDGEVQATKIGANTKQSIVSFIDNAI